MSVKRAIINKSMKLRFKKGEKKQRKKRSNHVNTCD